MPATAAGFTDLTPPLSSVEGFDNPFERADDGLPAHAFAVAREGLGFAPQPVRGAPGKTNHADGLFRRAATGARDAGDPQRDRAFAPRERSLRHLARGLLAHGAVLFQC